jgi:hypothetical protein
MGSEPSLRRPVLIVQENHFNRSRLATVIVLSVTSNTRLSEIPGNVLIKSEESGLPKDSVINVSQIATIDKNWLESEEVWQKTAAGDRLVGRHTGFKTTALVPFPSIFNVNAPSSRTCRR